VQSNSIKLISPGCYSFFFFNLAVSVESKIVDPCRSGGFLIGSEQLNSLSREHNLSSLQELGGV
jgi:hypothetical protein